MHEAADDLHKEKKDAARLAIATRLRAKADRKGLAGAGSTAKTTKLDNPVSDEGGGTDE